jgi:antitoxin ParD1/3/4
MSKSKTGTPSFGYPRPSRATLVPGGRELFLAKTAPIFTLELECTRHALAQKALLLVVISTTTYKCADEQYEGTTMANVEKLSVSLSKDLAEMVRGAVGENGYTSSSEIIREALRDWRVKQAVQAADITRLQKAWKQGMRDVESDQCIEINSQADATALVEDIRTRGLKKLVAQRTD